MSADLAVSASDFGRADLEVTNPEGVTPIGGFLSVSASDFAFDGSGTYTTQISFELLQGSSAGTWKIEVEAVDTPPEDFEMTIAEASQTFEIADDGCQDVDPPVVELTATPVDGFLNDCDALGGVTVNLDVQDDGGLKNVAVTLLDASGNEVDRSKGFNLSFTYNVTEVLSVPETGEPGVYSVVVTASDVNGNEFSQTESVTIAEVQTPECPTLSLSNLEVGPLCPEGGEVRFDLTATNFLHTGDEIYVKLDELFGSNSTSITLEPHEINAQGTTEVTLAFSADFTPGDYELTIFGQAGGNVEIIDEFVSIKRCSTESTPTPTPVEPTATPVEPTPVPSATPVPSVTPVPQPTATTTPIVVTVPTATPSFVWDGEPSHDKAPVASVKTPSTPDTPTKEPASAAPAPQAPKKVDDPAPASAGGGLAMTGSATKTLALAGFLIVLAGLAFRSGSKQLKGQP